MKKNKILILGADGMVGKTVFKYLKENYKDEVFGTSRRNRNFILFNINNTQNIKSFLTGYSFVINCIGINKVNKKNIKEAYSINFNFPQKIDELSKNLNFKFIHISTDAVYKIDAGKVTELDKPNTKELYGLTKLKGESKSFNSLTIRTSILGLKNNKQHGLLEWIRNANETIDGFENQSWSGCTSFQFAILCKYIISKNNFNKLRKKSNVYHFCPLGPTNKYEIVKNAARLLNKEIKVNKSVSDTSITRYLFSVYFDKKFYKSYTTSLVAALKKLISYE